MSEIGKETMAKIIAKIISMALVEYVFILVILKFNYLNLC